MEIDAVGLVGKYPTIVVYTVVDLPSICFLIDFRAEHSRNLMLDDLKYCARMNDHEVDVHTSSGVSTCGTVGRRLCKSYLCVESAGRYSYNSHTVIHFNFAVDIRIAVLRVTSDVLFEVSIDERIYEQDSSFIRNFLVIKLRFACLNEVCDVVRS